MKRTFLMTTFVALAATAFVPLAAADCTWHDQTTYLPNGASVGVHSTSCEQSYGEWRQLHVGVHEDHTGERVDVSAYHAEYELDRFGNDSNATTYRYEYGALHVGAWNEQGDLVPAASLQLSGGREEGPYGASQWRSGSVTLWWAGHWQSVGGGLPVLP